MNRRKFLYSGSALAFMGCIIPGVATSGTFSGEEYSSDKAKKVSSASLDDGVLSVVNAVQTCSKDVGFLGVSALAILLKRQMPSILMYCDPFSVAAVRRTISSLRVDYIPTAGTDGGQIQFGHKNVRYVLIMKKPELLAQAAALTRSHIGSSFAHDKMIYSHSVARLWDPYEVLNDGKASIQILAPRISVIDQTSDFVACELLKGQLKLNCDRATSQYAQKAAILSINDRACAEGVLALLVKSLPQMESQKNEDDLIQFASNRVFTSSWEALFGQRLDLRERYESMKRHSTQPLCKSAVILASLFAGDCHGKDMAHITDGPSPGMSLTSLDQNVLKLFMANRKANVGLNTDAFTMLKRANELCG